MTHPSHCLAPPPKGEESGTERVIVSDKGMKTIENSVHVVPNSPASSAVKKPVEGPKVTSKSSAETPTPVVKKRRAKKPEDMPRRPLSAYNIFFQNQRRMIVNGESSMPFTLQTPRAPRATRCRKRLHRKMHGKIGFVDLAKTIGRKWKSLNVEEKKPYLKLAELEKAKYHEEMKVYTFKKKNPLWLQQHKGNHDILTSMLSSSAEQGTFSTQHINGTTGIVGGVGSNYQHSFPHGNQGVVLPTSFQPDTSSQHPSSRTYLQPFHQLDSRPDVHKSNSYHHQALFHSGQAQATTHLQSFTNECRNGYEQTHQKEEFQTSHMKLNHYQPSVNYVTPRNDSLITEGEIMTFLPTSIRGGQNNKNVQYQSMQHTGIDVSTHEKRFDINFETIFEDEPSADFNQAHPNNFKDFEPFPYATPSSDKSHHSENKYYARPLNHASCNTGEVYPNYSLANQHNGDTPFQSPTSSRGSANNRSSGAGTNGISAEFTNDDIVEFLQPLFLDNMEAV